MSLTQLAVFMSLQISLALSSHLSSCVDWSIEDLYTEVLKLSVECKPNETVLAWEFIGKPKSPIRVDPGEAFSFVNLEYICRNETSGESITTCLESFSYKHSNQPDAWTSGGGNKSVTDDADFYDEEINCTFRACFAFNAFSINVHYDEIYAWNSDSVMINCQTSDTTMAVSPSPSPSVTAPPPSPTPSLLMHDPAAAMNSPTSSDNITSLTNTTGAEVPEGTSDEIESNIDAAGSSSIPSAGSSSIPSAEIAFSVISILVIFIGGTAIVILIVVCFSYRKWLRKTTSIHYEYNVKQVYDDPLKSINVYNIDNISINESNITVLHSLAVQPNDYDASHMSTNRGTNFEKLDFSISQMELNNEYEELDSISECSTIALQSNGEQDKARSLMIKENLHEVVENNLYSAPPTRVVPMKSRNASENSASLYQRNDCLPVEIPPAGTGYKRRDDTVFDGYITEKIQTNQTENQRLNSSTESAYEGSSMTSSEQGTPSTGYLTRTLVEGCGTDGYCQRTQVYSSSRSPSNYSLLEGVELDDCTISSNGQVPGNGKETDVKSSAATLEFTSSGYLTNTGQQPKEINEEGGDSGCTYISTEYQQHTWASPSDYLGKTLSEQMVGGSVEDVSVDICETVNSHPKDTTSFINGASDRDSHAFDVANNAMASHLITEAPVARSAGYIDGQTVGMGLSQHNTGTPVMEDTQLDLCEVDEINTSPAHYPAPPPHIITSLTSNTPCDTRTDGYTSLPRTDNYTSIHTDNNDYQHSTVLMTQSAVAHPTDDGYL